MNYPHGHPNCWRRGCKCLACKQGWSDYSSLNRRLRRAGTPLTIPVDETRNHIRRLYAGGYTVAGIAGAAGLSVQCVNAIRHGKTKATRIAVADAILAIETDMVADAHLVPADHARELVRSITDHGHTQGQVATWIGKQSPQLPFMCKPWRYTRSRTVRKLHALRRVLVKNGALPASVLEEVAP